MANDLEDSIRELVDRSTRGDPRSAEELLPALYEQLRQLAAARVARTPPGNTVQATELVHEAWMRLVENGDPGWDGRGHFFGAAARAMRNVLVDRQRARGAVKRGGDRRREELDGLIHVDGAPTAS
ncbi:ECF-type sigma factor [Engelhardtia mirabilis]|uniref:ECF sigma factor n=1 Tax=Engelhardtia mirabilis TaxID=2528011 RepID=A0A518BS24_9BACT|nr:ECF sigma factor [Planctomycetes bacterium Pla133]QDV04095.1 ECF sigma factor [Planctomycetes bacterium Pla86]